MKILLTLLLLTSFSPAQETKDQIPVQGKFPPAGVAKYFAGELVAIDHVNRRGALRLDGDGSEDAYHSAPSHQFAILPYGTLTYHGALAELRDIPIGTHLHGHFLLPPEGDTTIPAPSGEGGKYVPPYNHALTLEDDFSYHQGNNRAWKINAIDLAKGTLDLTLTPGDKKPEVPVTIDRSTRIWKGRTIATLEDLAPDQLVQINFTWAPDWRFGQFHAADIWIDDESRVIASEAQRQLHIRYLTHRWLPGWIDHVEHQPGGKGIVTLTLFAGPYPSFFENGRVKPQSGHFARLAASDNTLRTWWKDNDSTPGHIIETKDLPNPPPGSSGLQIRIPLDQLLDGIRPGRIIRIQTVGLPMSRNPAEERIKSLIELLNDRRK